MRCRWAILAATAALSACGSSSVGTSSASSVQGSGGSRGSRPAPCGPRQARTLASSPTARVYASSGLVYGCSARGGRRTRLGQTRSCLGTPRVAPVALAGELAAYGLQTCATDTGDASVLVRRLDTGRVIGTVAAVAGRPGPESFGSVGSVVLNAAGSVAWIGVATSIVSHSVDIEVHALAGGGDRLLDRGPEVDPRSLRLRRDVLSWRHGKTTRSARLA